MNRVLFPLTFDHILNVRAIRRDLQVILGRSGRLHARSWWTEGRSCALVAISNSIFACVGGAGILAGFARCAGRRTEQRKRRQIFAATTRRQRSPGTVFTTWSAAEIARCDSRVSEGLCMTALLGWLVVGGNQVTRCWVEWEGQGSPPACPPARTVRRVTWVKPSAASASSHSSPDSLHPCSIKPMPSERSSAHCSETR